MLRTGDGGGHDAELRNVRSIFLVTFTDPHLGTRSTIPEIPT